MLFVEGRLHPGISVVKIWISRKRAKGKTADGNPKFVKGVAHGRIMLKVKEPLKPGFKTSLVVVTVVKKDWEETRYPVPAILVEIIEPSR